MALGYLVAAALLPDVAATLRGLYGAAVGRELALRPKLVGRRGGDERRRRAADGGGAKLGEDAARAGARRRATSGVAGGASAVDAGSGGWRALGLLGLERRSSP